MLTMTCWAPASEKSPKRSTIAPGGLGVAAAILVEMRTSWRVERSISFGVAADVGAVLGEDRVLAGDALGRAEDVGRVGVAGHEAQGLLLTAAPDHDRDPGA